MTTFDISDTLAPNSDQLDAVDLLGGPQNFTISKVSKGNPEQPVQVHLAEFDRPWRPGKSMRRVMVACWGPDANQYVGRSIRLWCDPKVAFGGQDVGGVRILALSHIDKPRAIPLLVSRGKSAMYKVDVLKVEQPKPEKASADMLAKLTDLFDSKGLPEAERPDVQNLTVDEARNVWRTLQSRPDVAPEPTGAMIPAQEPTGDWPEVRQPGGAS
jgi:hypothetical protein